MQLAVFIPLIVGLQNGKRLDPFGVLIVWGLMLSLLCDGIGTYTDYVYKTSQLVVFFYDIVSLAIIGIAWTKVEDFTKNVKLIILLETAVGIFLVCLFEILQLNLVVSYVSISFTLVFGLHYYYSKIFGEHTSNYILEPKFIIASAYIFFCMSVMVMYTSFHFVNERQFPYIWTLKQVFYVFFNIILAYGLSLYGKKNQSKWTQESL